MKVLHLYANHKWTGPADLAIESVRGLRDAGCDATLALAGFVHKGMEHAMRARARAAGIATIEGLELRRHFHLRSILRDARTLRSWIEAGDFDLLHTHQDGDHLVAALALRKAKRRVPLVRSLWDGVAPASTIRRRIAARRTTAWTLPVLGAEGELAARFGADEGLVRGVAGPVGAAFLADVPVDEGLGARRALREELGLAGEQRLVGITARIQEKRRWDLLWDLTKELPRDVHVCVLGRPDAGVFESVCAQPLRARGLAERVHFLGYRSGDAYRHALLALDAFVFLVPGSDATCRALREAMALALPVVVTDLGLLPRIVEDGDSGFVRAPDAHALARALVTSLENVELANRHGRAAQAEARANWSPAAVTSSLLALYREV